MLSEADLKYQYINRNIMTIIQNIKNNDYDYCKERHDELKAVLNYLLLLTLENHNNYAYCMLEEFTESVRNIVLDDSQIDMVLNLKPKYILIFATSSMNSKLEDGIIATSDAYYIYKFARFVKGANIEKLEDAIIATSNIKYIYYFARDIKGANHSKLTDAAISIGNAEYIYYFARYIKGANIEKLGDAIIATGIVKYIYYFARDVKGVNLSKLEDAIIAIGNIEYIYYFARSVKGANIPKLEDVIVATNNIKYIYCFARDVKKANIPRLEDIIIATGDPEYIYYFACDVKRANIEKLTDAIIATNNAEYIYRFALNVKGANIEKLLNAILNTQNEHYITLFMCLIQNNNFDLYEDLNSPNYSEKNSLTSIFSSITEKTNLGSYLLELNLSIKIRRKFVDYLFANMEKGNNYLILRVYLKMLNKPIITKEEAKALDLEYATALKKQESSTFKPQNPILEIRKMADDSDSNNNK